ncbi:hypothetical protein [Clostridium sp.]
MKMSKEEFVKRYREDKAQKDLDKYFAKKAADNFRYEGKGKNIRRKHR